MDKPLGRKSYGSIGHLPYSRLGPTDSCVDYGQANICCSKTRDRYDRVIVTEKLDGSNCAVAKVGGKIVALGRAGYLAETSPFEQHRMFADWVAERADRFDRVLGEGERVCGEWLAQAHGTIYDLRGREPFMVFDLMVDDRRVLFDEFMARLGGVLSMPQLIHDGGAIGVSEAMAIHENKHSGCDETEGVVYRVERRGRVEFLAKFVRQDKVDGKYLPELTGCDPIWNWRPS